MPNNIIPALGTVAPNGSDGPKYNEDVNLLNSDPEEKVEDSDAVAPDEEEEEGSEEVNKEEEEIEEEANADALAEDSKDKIKPDIPYDRPSISEIKAKFPEFFKTFPALRDAFYREVEFTKMFPTVEDAKEAFEDNEAFTTLQNSITEGDAEPFISALESQGSIVPFARNFLSSLYEKSKDSYEQVTTPLFEGLLRWCHKSSDENERNAAEVISNMLFGTSEVAEGKKTFTKEIKSPEKKGDDPAIRESHVKDAGGKANQALATLIDRTLDPNKTLTPFLRKQVILEIINGVHEQLGKDTAHISIMNSRWNRAKLDGYSDDSKAKIISTFLARAKSVIPEIRSKVMKEALGTQSRAAGDKEKKISQNITRKEVPGGPPTKRLSTENGKVDYRKMSDLDILNS